MSKRAHDEAFVDGGEHGSDSATDREVPRPTPRRRDSSYSLSSHDSDNDGMFDFISGKPTTIRRSTFELDETRPEAVEDIFGVLPDGHIRLLSLDRSSEHDAQIVAHTHHVPLANVPGFYALSYAWGTIYEDQSHLTHTISCDEVAIRVTATLHDALRRCRKLFLDEEHAKESGTAAMTYLWVDAICINQSNFIERSEQVGIMGMIYERAAGVVIWLGEDILGKSMPRLAAYSDQVEAALSFTLWSEDGTQRNEEVSDGVSDRDILEGILRLPWFRRRWVLQEVALQSNRLFLIGGHQFSFPVLKAAMKRAGLHHTLLEQISTERPLMYNLYVHRQADCSDAVDRIYALRGMSADKDRVRVNYHKSASEVCLDVAKRYAVAPGSWLGLLVCAILFRNGSEDVFGDADGLDPNKPTEQEEPSWVPRLRLISSKEDTDFRSEHIDVIVLESCFSYSARPCLTVDDDLGLLILEAHLVWNCNHGHWIEGGEDDSSCLTCKIGEAQGPWHCSSDERYLYGAAKWPPKSRAFVLFDHAPVGLQVALTWTGRGIDYPTFTLEHYFLLQSVTLSVVDDKGRANCRLTYNGRVFNLQTQLQRVGIA
ncbi:hypothetical protein LTR62_004295 [Meristemomyces frigidus]|uniref:Heterokaryon incompatibility domain-containing protein n=1 Tax=Meristemomyces frigidus TaxID=1508187 RepID=A0AAN7YGA4_9PEZI|nr:hypothetical protein LTR62_004295 [Meristemomyces frigidus]